MDGAATLLQGVARLGPEQGPYASGPAQGPLSFSFKKSSPKMQTRKLSQNSGNMHFWPKFVKTRKLYARQESCLQDKQVICETTFFVFPERKNVLRQESCLQDNFLS